MKKEDNYWPSATTIIKPGYCQKIFLTYLFNETKTELEGILLSTGKMGGCVNTHLHSFFGLLNYIIENNDYDDIMVALSSLSGSKCSFGDSCIDMIVKDVISTLMSLKEDSQDEIEESEEESLEPDISSQQEPLI